MVTSMTKPYHGVAGFDLGIDDDIATPSTVPDPIQSLRENIEFLTDLCRFSEGLELYTEAAVRKKWRLPDAVWKKLGGDDELVRAIDEIKSQRLRSGARKRELAQGHVIRGPAVLVSIMDDPKANARHRVDSIRTLNQIADPPEAAPEREYISIRIDLSADTRARGQEPNPGDVITIEAEPRLGTPRQIEDGHSERPDDEWKR